DLVRRKIAEHREAGLAVALEAREREGDDEHLGMVPDVAVLAVPRGEVDVEEGILLHQVGVNGVDLLELAVRRREERVEDLQAEILLGGRHAGHRFLQDGRGILTPRNGAVNEPRWASAGESESEPVVDRFSRALPLS